MLELTFTAADLARTRFAVSPLWEVVAGVRVVKDPAAHPVHRRWAEEVRPRLARLDWAPLADLVPVPTRVIPGFVCPPPATSVPDLSVELAAVRATPAERVRRGLSVVPRTPATDALAADPARGLARLAEAIEAYWEVALAPYWPRVLRLLEEDVLRRARRFAEGGVRELLGGLDPAVRWDDETLVVAHRHVRRSSRLRGRGLLLVPSAFVWPRVFSVVDPPYQPALRYPPDGVATLWEAAAPVPDALAAVVGRSRARLLAELTSPASTQELTRRTGLSAGAVSQHLTTLRAAGLVASFRAGRFVLYRRTSAAEALLTASATA
ncbi:ArsR/SmtB family transcription factor [Bailinhaonella thermotolerans]|uniref:ArsR family transcriptional regulator n=1 Tax=Bailinhaonella thermotolerans TaxID=1070861 RepID=A0A3A4ARQ0_9ACTN|nr:DUF5937 family protein [Bailinhaonella thermotolerans]RJL32528.1 ArsR family transcriptional regulator [Bailinhaonella thermotolerans]